MSGTTNGSWTGWKFIVPQLGAYNYGYYTDISIGSAEANLVSTGAWDCLGADQIMISLVNNSTKDATVKFFTSEDETIGSPTHSALEWDQEPDAATTYTLGSTGHASGPRLKKALDGPVRWAKVRIYHTTVTSVGSVDCYVHMKT